MKPWEDKIRHVLPYVPGEQPKQSDVIKLNTNENPYPPAPGVKEKMAGLDADRFMLYPDPAASLLVDSIADFYGVESSQVFVGVGSDDVISMAFLTFFNSDKPILFPDITYSFYSVWADVYRIPYKQIPLGKNFRINPDDYKIPCGGVIFPNPNAPTSLYMPLDGVEEIIKANRDVIVIVDEAYIDFGGESALKLIDRYDNLLIVQTFSKSRSMAGMRIGYAIGNKDLIKALNDVKYSVNSYTMNYPSIVLGSEAIKDRAYFEDTVNRIKATRENFCKKIAGLGFKFPESSANFVFVSHPEHNAKQLFEELKKHNIFVRYFDKPGIDNYLRITIGTDGQMDVLYSFLKEYAG